ncbi:MAG: primosomal protein N' [bacterium]|nr:primosomal protein N' [bacterium]
MCAGSQHATPSAGSPTCTRVRVVFETRLNHTYDYCVPPALAALVRPGTRVVAPLGKSERVGYVVECDPPKLPGVQYRPILRMLDTDAAITPEMMALAQFVARYYYCSLGAALRCCMPAPVRKRSETAVMAHVVKLARPREEVLAHVQAIRSRAPRMAELLRLLATHPHDEPIRLSALVARAQTSVATVRTLERQGWLTVSLEKQRPRSEEGWIPVGAPALTPAQQHAVQTILAARDTFRVFLLQGVTGSGKTEVYLRVIGDALQRGRGAIVLVPEIALTPQTVERFRARFGERVAVLHSSLTDHERLQQWWSIRDGHARIVVGARSALFAPVQRPGVIVVDEEHERTYKQADEVPRYHARDLAVMRGRLHGCPVILGSATPSLESLYNVWRKKYQLLELPERVAGGTLPSIRLVDMREEVRVAPQLAIISRPLREALKECLGRREQAVLFLNRRGYCPVLACPTCYYVHHCPQCAVSLSYHASQQLICHVCGHTEPYAPPYHCPECRRTLALVGFGTQRVEKHLATLFPHARIARMDRDTTQRRGSHERILSAFGAGHIDILLGTQMIAKGLDFPNVTVVGVLNADIALHAPDFRATEYTWQLITQVAGRAGRSDKPGIVIVQSAEPSHPAITAAISGRWREFARTELEARRTLAYPPFSHLINLIIKGRDEHRVITAAQELVLELGYVRERLSPTVHGCVQVLGPAPASLPLAHGFHRWQVTLKSSAVCASLDHLVTPALRAKSYRGVEIIVDVDP